MPLSPNKLLVKFLCALGLNPLFEAGIFCYITQADGQETETAQSD